MMKKRSDIVTLLKNEIKCIQTQVPSDIVDVFQFRISKAGAGVENDNQIFTTWFFGGGDVGYLANWFEYLIELTNSKKFDKTQLIKMMRYWVIQPAEFGNYCGFYKQYEMICAFNEVVEDLNLTEWLEILELFKQYYRTFDSWMYHYYPWEAGQSFLRKNEDYYRKLLSDCFDQ